MLRKRNGKDSRASCRRLVRCDGYPLISATSSAVATLIATLTRCSAPIGNGASLPLLAKALWRSMGTRSFASGTEMIEKYDTHFFVGTVHQHPGSWTIVGLFYPPKRQSAIYLTKPPTDAASSFSSLGWTSCCCWMTRTDANPCEPIPGLPLRDLPPGCRIGNRQSQPTNRR